MSLLSDLTNLVEALDIPVETGVFTDTAPDRYLVLVPLSDTFDIHADRCVSPYTRRAATPKRRTLL